MKIIDNSEKSGFMVLFEWAGDGFLRSDYFPDKHAGERLIPTEYEAWNLAERFAASLPKRIVNVYVANANFTPVSSRGIKNR